MAKSSPGATVLRIENFRYAGLREALRSRDDHHAVGVGPHDVAVVVDLDALGPGRQTEQLARRPRAASPGPANSASLRSSASRALVSACWTTARFSPRWGTTDLDFAPGLERERFGHQRLLRQRHGWSAPAAAAACRRRTGRRRRQHLGRSPPAWRGSGRRPDCRCCGRRGRRTPARRSGPPDLPRRDHVRVLQAGRVHDAAALHEGERPDAVPDRRCRLEGERLRRLLHLGRQLALDGASRAGQKALGLRDESARTRLR